MSAIVLVAAVFALLLRSYRPELGLVLVLSACAVAILVILSVMRPVIKQLATLFEQSGIKMQYFTVVLKALGIAYITGFAADSCRDFGFASLGAKTELAGRCAVLALSVPLLSEVLQTALGLVGV